MASAPEDTRSRSHSEASVIPAVRYISAEQAAAIDEELMSPQGCGYLLPQLMELAGLACASALFKSYPPDVCPSLLVAAGPGNQGGDGLVAARHAKMWGYEVNVWYPKQGKAEIFQSLRRQCETMHIPFIEEDEFDEAVQAADVVLDCIFGFSFKGPARAPFAAALEVLGSESRLEYVGRVTRPPIVSVDIPSGWSVDSGNPSTSSTFSQLSVQDSQQPDSSSTSIPSSSSESKSNSFIPEVVISLTAPKRGMKGYTGRHFLGGRFVPNSIIQKYSLEGLDGYELDNQVVEISNWADADEVEPDNL
ncbi:unnamed protein product [Sympodiomycopsis kandeliae]